MPWHIQHINPITYNKLNRYIEHNNVIEHAMHNATWESSYFTAEFSIFPSLPLIGFGIENSTLQEKKNISMLDRNISLFFKRDHLNLLHALKCKPFGTIMHIVHKIIYIKCKRHRSIPQWCNSLFPRNFWVANTQLLIWVFPAPEFLANLEKKPVTAPRHL